MLNNQDDVLKDVNYVLENLDKGNAKALFRRAHAYKVKNDLGKAIADLEQLTKLEPGNAQCKKELIELKSKHKEAPKTQNPLIEEVEVKTSSPQKVE